MNKYEKYCEELFEDMDNLVYTLISTPYSARDYSNEDEMRFCFYFELGCDMETFKDISDMVYTICDCIVEDYKLEPMIGCDRGELMIEVIGELSYFNDKIEAEKLGLL